jgi:hypothetical protein
MFAFPNGSADVDAGSSNPRAIADATSDCVGAVIEDLVATKVVPTLKAKAGQ